jgi:hypothetical protein
LSKFLGKIGGDTLETKKFGYNENYLLEVQKDGKQYNFDVKIALSSDSIYKASAIDLKNGMIIDWFELKETNLSEEVLKQIENALNNL